MTAVSSIAALGLIFYNGIIDRPGEPRARIGSSTAGSWRCSASLLMLVGVRHALQPSTSARRKPPGTI